MGRQGRAALRPLAGRHPPLRPQPPRHRLGAHAHARGLRQALHHGLAVRGVSVGPAAAPLAALRPAARRRAPCFGEKLGWERPNWFAARRARSRRTSTATAGRTGSRPSAASTGPAASASALFDQTSFAKFLLVGRDAEAALSWICANDVAKPPGRLVYTQMLNARGGIECDLTVARLRRDRLLHRHRHRLRHPRFRLDRAQHPRRARRAAGRRDLALRRAVADGAARARRAGGGDRATTSRTPPSRSARCRRIARRRRAGAGAARHLCRRARLGAARPGRVRGHGLRRADGGRRSRTASPTPATAPSSRCGWRRATAPGAPTSARTTRRSRPASAGR